MGKDRQQLVADWCVTLAVCEYLTGQVGHDLFTEAVRDKVSYSLVYHLIKLLYALLLYDALLATFDVCALRDSKRQCKGHDLLYRFAIDSI